MGLWSRKMNKSQSDFLFLFFPNLIYSQKNSSLYLFNLSLNKNDGFFIKTKKASPLAEMLLIW
jgi:hypothetical protein